jgi:iron-sulfur cluster assembly protein
MLQWSYTGEEGDMVMLELTDLAASKLQNMFLEQNLTEHGLRVFVQGGGCAGLQYGMAFENATREGDTVVEAKGVRLFVDPFSAQYLKGACIDYQDTLMGSGFRVDNPNATASCACGSSFRGEGEEAVEKPCQ